MNAHVVIPPAPVRILEVVTKQELLAALEPAWTELWRKLDGPVFQSHGWIAAWWRTAPDRDRRSLLIGLVWNGEALEAVLPLAIVRRGGVRMLEWAAKDHTDYGDILVAPDCDAGKLAALWRRLLAEGGFDIAYLNRLLPDAAVRPLLAGEGPVRFHANHRTELNFRVAGPWRTGAEWFESQSKKTRQNYRRGCKFIEEKGALRFRLMDAAEPTAPVLDRVAALKRKWLAQRGHESDLFDEGSPALAALVSVMAELGILRIFVLECAGVVVAISINFVQHDRMMAFVTTYDPDFERGSPGMVLMMDYIRWSIDQGLEMVDFLCGGEDFKRRFATRSLTLDSMIGARTLRGRLAVLADEARHRVRSWRASRQTTVASTPVDASDPG
jgi:CelD/BcsL family acetyltransferase involved in cellulose biosynthesis